MGEIYEPGIGSSFNFEIDSDKGKFKPFMGSYGIGVSRIPAAVIEHSNDTNGIIWPKNISPFMIHLINLLHDEDESENKNLLKHLFSFKRTKNGPKKK